MTFFYQLKLLLKASGMIAIEATNSYNLVLVK